VQFRTEGRATCPRRKRSLGGRPILPLPRIRAGEDVFGNLGLRRRDERVNEADITGAEEIAATL